MRQIVMGCYTKFLATYETSFWREAGLSGQLTRYTDNQESVASSPVSLVMDAVTPNNNAALVGFFTGFGASHWASKPVCSIFYVGVFAFSTSMSICRCSVHLCPIFYVCP